MLDLPIECEEACIKSITFLKTWDKKTVNLYQSTKAAFKFRWKLHQIEDFAQKIDQFRASLILATMLALRSSAESNYEDVLEHLQNLQIDVRNSTSGTDATQLQNTIDNLSNGIRDHTAGRLGAIHIEVSSYLEGTKKIRRTHIKSQPTIERSQAILRWLSFTQVHWRHDAVPEAYRETFSWIFETHHESQAWDYFTAHLEQDVGSPYLVNGKAGSGKSTLMKLIVNDSRTRNLLGRWAGQDPLVILTFFWDLGTTLQKSHAGLLRALLYTVLERLPDALSNRTESS